VGHTHFVVKCRFDLIRQVGNVGLLTGAKFNLLHDIKSSPGHKQDVEVQDQNVTETSGKNQADMRQRSSQIFLILR